nr:NTF2 fold immunity protein [uncultured Flavobacterium sp.]
MKKYLLLFFLLTFSVVAIAQEKRTSISKQDALKYLNQALTGNETHNVIDNKTALLPSQADAIAFAELILFRIYGEENIKRQRPYGCFHINNHWIISGSLPDDSLGGTFLIIIDDRNAKVVQITHGK